MSNNFNTIAPVYDFLAKMVFGRSLERAQAAFLSDLETKVKAKAKVLIVGGGTGKVLELLPEGLDLQIDYVEMSKGMLERAKGRVSKGNHVQLICEDVRKVKGQYDFVITNFFLDCFSSKDLGTILSHLKGLLDSGGKLFVTDFYPTNVWHQKLLIQSMHVFFKIASRLKANELINIHERIKDIDLIPTKLAFFSRGSVFSAVYERLPH